MASNLGELLLQEKLLTAEQLKSALDYQKKHNVSIGTALVSLEIISEEEMAQALSRQLGDREQRIVVIGDGDFLANSYISNAGNLDLGLALSRWLVGDNQMIGIPAPQASDSELHLSRLAIGIIGIGSLIVLPLLLLSGGGLMAWRRNRA